MSNVAGKHREVLAVITEGHDEDNKESGYGPSSDDVLAEVETEDFEVDKNQSSSGNEDPSLVESSGYNPKRQEFDPEYDNDAELLLAEMEFKDTDAEDVRELKLRVLRIYEKRLDERNRRTDFILERNLLHSNPFQFLKDLTPNEMTICRKYDIFMRFHSKEEHEEFLRTVISEHRTRIRLEELKEARTAGCRNSAEADRYLAHKRRRRETEENAWVGLSNQGVPNALKSPESAHKDSNAKAAGPASSSYVNGKNVKGYNGADLLSEPEKRLCCELSMPEAIYLKIQERLCLQILSGNISSKSDAHQLFKMDTHKTDRIHDMLIKRGIASP